MNHVRRIFHLNPDIVSTCQNIVRLNFPGEVENMTADFQRKIDLNTHPMFTWTDDNRIHGFIKGHRVDADRNLDSDGKYMWLDWLCVVPGYQHRGIGTALIQAYEHYCQVNGIYQITLKSSVRLDTLVFYTDKCHFDIIDDYFFIMAKRVVPGHSPR